MTTITNNKLPEWRKALNKSVENYQSMRAWYEENPDNPSAEQDMDAAAGEIEKLIKQYGVLIVLNLLDEIDELQERRKADSEPAGYHVIKECGKVGCSVATLEEAEKTRDFWNKRWTIRPYFYTQPALVATGATNSPVTQDGWISCSERMPEKGQNVLISVNFDSSLVEPLICSARYTGSTFRRGDATIKPGNGIEQATHWMPLTAAGGEVMNNLMIDLETMGKNKDAPIVSIGAVFFTPETGDIGQEFYTVVSLESAMGQGATPDGDTILWWLKQSPEARAAICIDDTLSISDALSELNHFINRHAANTKYLKVWGNGATFDNVILRGAYERAGQICPWAYWNDHDVRTIVTLGRSIGFDPKMDIPFDGERHNALADARHQAKYVSAIWQKLIPATSTEL
ncbi:3'-5' exoribonuclease [Salmonella enterica]|nr:3'-5' exoribonuclease [Salmonella enterica]